MLVSSSAKAVWYTSTEIKAECLYKFGNMPSFLVCSLATSNLGFLLLTLDNRWTTKLRLLHLEEWLKDEGISAHIATTWSHIGWDDIDFYPYRQAQ